MLGVDYNSSTYIHFVEVIYWHNRLEHNPEAKYIGLNRPTLGKFWDRVGHLNRGRVGDADCRLFRIREYIDTLRHEVGNNLDRYVN